MTEIAIIYASKTGNTKRCAEWIAEGVAQAGMQALCLAMEDVKPERLANCGGVIFGSSTRYAGLSADMTSYLQSYAHTLKLKGKLGGAFATSDYEQGGATTTIMDILRYELLLGMLVYSGGASEGKPYIHMGPVGIAHRLETFKSTFVIFGERFAHQALSLYM